MAADTERDERRADRLQWWIMGILTTMILTILGALHSSAMNRIERMEQTMNSRGERMAAIEAVSRALEQGQADLKAALLRIETKLDRLYDRGTAGPK